MCSISSINPAMGGQGNMERFQISVRQLATIAENEVRKPGRKLLIWVGPGWPILNRPSDGDSSKEQRRYFDSIVELSNRLREARMTKVGWWNPSHFLDSGDLLLLDELPHIDCSRGGVYFVGSSNLRMALKDWDRSPQEKALVHNLGVPGTNHLFNFQTLRYLVENEGLLRAGGEKTLIVFGVSYHCVGHEYDKTCYFATLLGRHGLYSCHTASRTVCATKVCRLSIGSGLSRRREWGAS